MAYYLNFDGVDDHVTIPSYSLQVGDVIEIVFTNYFGINGSDRYILDSTGGTRPYVLIDSFGKLSFNTAVMTVQFDGAAVADREVLPATMTDGADHTITCTMTSAATLDTIGARFTLASFLNAGIKSLTITGATNRNYDPSASNGTGAVLPDTISSQDGTLVNFPTDGSQWVSYVSPTDPALTVTQATLTPGGTISGSYSNYATIPTTLTVSDGTNTISSGGASPKITGLNIDDTAKTYTATVAALPTTGTSDMILFTDNAIVELS